ncbi:MAG TPA: replication-associated recombination protein A [Actinomycetota bacterium]|nr:replication-associated recombination protein A [Actinomycetota bacterium]
MAQEPLAARMRPRTLEDVVGQRHLLGEGKALAALVGADHLPSIVLWGPAGTGKTTLAHLLARAVGAEMVQLSAVSSGVADARKVLESSRGGMLQTVLFVDEVHRWSKSQQDVLLPGVEAGDVTFIGATTENPYFSLVSPLLSRSLLLRLEPLTEEDVRSILERAIDDERGLPGAKVEDEALSYLAETAGGDARLALSGLEAAARVAAGRLVTKEMAEDVVQRRGLVYDRDEHYDVISAFIKSMRGSDPDAALFWLTRMLEAGEDPRFIARRMVIFASEDVGLADPAALQVAVAAAHAVELVGLPEVRLNLGHAAAYLSKAPKSNAVIRALGKADEAQRRAGRVPGHLRDAHYAGAKDLGHGEGYAYPPGDPEGAKGQRYLPEGVEGGFLE